MVGRFAGGVLILVWLSCRNYNRAEEQSFGYCGGSFSNPPNYDPDESSPKFKRNVEEYEYVSEKDIPPVRPKHLGFSMKVWPTEVFYRKVISNKNMVDQYNKTMDNVLSFFSNLLGVLPHNQTHLYNATDCLQTQKHLQNPEIPCVYHESRNGFINVTGYDHHLVIDSGLQKPCGPNENTLGWARQCAASAKYDGGSSNGEFKAPGLISLIYLCQGQLTGNRMQDNKLEQTIKHEVLHNLGISSVHLRSVRESSHQKIDWKSAYGTYKKDVVYNTNRLVIDAARMHFNCSTLVGGEVEGSGGDGTASSHWEMRVFGPILMVGMISRQSYFSNISLSFLRGLLWRNGTELVPWYPWVNVSMAEDQWYGKNAGCRFANGSCMEYIYDRPMESTMPRTASFPFGSPENLQYYRKYMEKEVANVVLRACSPNRVSVMSCGIDPGFTISENESQLMHLYYKGEWLRKMQGTNKFTEYCPVFSDVSDQSIDTYCKNEHSKPTGANNPGGELFGATSGCFEQSVPFTKIDCNQIHLLRLLTGHGKSIEGYSGAGCYQFLCKHRRLSVQAAGEDGRYGYKVCWAEGTKIILRRMIDPETFVHGNLICPSCRVMCGEQFPCAPDVHGIEPRDQLETPCASAAFRNTPTHIYCLLLVLVLCIFL